MVVVGSTLTRRCHGVVCSTGAQPHRCTSDLDAAGWGLVRSPVALETGRRIGAAIAATGELSLRAE